MLDKLFKVKRRKASASHHERGLQIVEMAMVMPIFMLLMAGIVELSWYFYTYSTLSRATRAGAAYIYSKPFDSAEILKAKYLVLCGDMTNCNSPKKPMVDGLTLSNIDVSLAGTAPNRTVTVKIINYSFSSGGVFDLQNLGQNLTWNTSVTKINAATTLRYIGNL